MPAPLVAIITPCFNAAKFIEETILSVLQQDYPRLEYLVMDGGSTDGTLEILERYRGRLRYCSGKDAGQGDAINRGFALTQGEIFAFLNADDIYLPGAVARAAAEFEHHPEAAVVYGDAWHVDEQGRAISPYPTEPYDSGRLARRCFICQPAAFIRRDAFAEAGGMNAGLRFAIDYDLWIRLARRHPMVKVDSFLANSRLHAAAKTVGQTGEALRETIEILRRHYGYAPFNWIYGYAHHRLTGQPLAAVSPGRSWKSASFAVALGLCYNWRHPIRYGRDIQASAREGVACSQG